jgi:hypothetical protein
MPTSTTTMTNAEAPPVELAPVELAPVEAPVVPDESGDRADILDVPVSDLPTAPSPIAVTAPRVHAQAPAAAASTSASAPGAPAEAAPEPVAVTPSPAPAVAPPSTGSVRVPAPYVVIVVDGQHKRVVDGRVVLPCGRHKIRAGMRDAEIVDVPCGGVASL